MLLLAIDGFCAGMPHSQRLPTWSDVVDPEVYGFYSSVLQAEHFGLQERVAIAVEPLGFSHTFDCSRPLRREDQLLVEAARTHRERLWRWQERFHFGRDYVLVQASNILEARKCVGAFRESRPIAGCKAYANVRDARFFSIPVFDASHTRALVTEDRLIGGGGEVQVYQKTGNSWKRDPAALVECVWSFSIP